MGQKNCELRGDMNALEDAMGREHHIKDEQIRHRAYCIWEADGRQDGRCAEYWERAKAELEDEFEMATDVPLAEEERTEFVMPRPSISMPIYRHEAARIDPDWFREAA